MLLFVSGLIIGGVGGFMFAALCFAARKSENNIREINTIKKKVLAR